MNIKIDSRQVLPNDTFIAIKTLANDGHLYVEDAIRKGATTVVVEEGIYPVHTIHVKDTKEYLIQYLKEHYYDTIKDIKLIGITGTNGKTTTCFLLYEAFKKLGKKAAYIGTIGFYMEEKVRDLENTTPEIIEIYQMLLECKEHQIEYVMMEVSSHALAMKRVDGILFDYAVFTNLTKDHLDYHLDMKHYALAKQQLFYQLKPTGKAIINIDDDYKNYFLRKENKNITYGFLESDYQIIENHSDIHGNIFEVNGNNKIETYHSTLLGKHNIYNLLVMIIILKEYQIPEQEIYEVVKEAKAPAGRMDIIPYKTNKIIVDYAHTPDAVSNILAACLELKPEHIYTIIGCGGNRDKTKRPEMALIATKLSTKAIFTSDNPRFEKPEDIIEDMIHSLDNKNYEIIVNRKNAIEKGIQILKNNDILLILGKGHENYQIVGKEKKHFDDKEVVLEII